MSENRAIAGALLNDPDHWRSRAAEARAVADSINDPEAKRTMVGIAASYDKLAQRAEERLLGGPVAKGS